MIACNVAETALAAARVGICLVLGTAGVSKMATPAVAQDLRRVVEALGVKANPAFPHVLSLTELALAGWLLSEIYSVMAAIVAAALLGGFAAVLSVLSIRGFTGSCGCFSSRSKVGTSHIILNLFLASVSIAVAVWPGPNHCLAQVLDINEPLLWAVVAALILLLAGVFAFLSEIRRVLSADIPATTV